MSLESVRPQKKIATKDMIMCALFTALIAVGAFIKVPVPVVPFTLQFLFTMLAGLIMGGRLGAVSVGLYAVLGLAGLPIFAEGGGIWYVMKPSFGYIIGFALGSLGDRSDGRKTGKADHRQAAGSKFYRACDSIRLRHDLLLHHLQLRDRNAHRILATVPVLLPAGGAGGYMPLFYRRLACKAPATGIPADPKLSLQ